MKTGKMVRSLWSMATCELQGEGGAVMNASLQTLADFIYSQNKWLYLKAVLYNMNIKHYYVKKDY